MRDPGAFAVKLTTLELTRSRSSGGNSNTDSSASSPRPREPSTLNRPICWPRTGPNYKPISCEHLMGWCGSEKYYFRRKFNKNDACDFG
ncbi:hypothetical protein BURPSPAST_N0014 [Burkholderia pseudomallei Pasteur 52237]|nr:hypothetical protein BURPSPAST_N0014 [Burkholderia pseudomallei Pasteur 52237]